MNAIQQRFARLGHQRQESVLAQSDQLGVRVAGIVGAAYRRMNEIMANPSGDARNRSSLKAALENMLAKLIATTESGLERIGRDSYQSAVNNWLRAVPKRYWQAAVQPAQEALLVGSGFVWEAEDDEIDISPLSARDELRPLRDGELSKKKTDSLLKRLLFKPPSKARAWEILNDPSRWDNLRHWRDVLKSQRLSFDTIVGQIASGMSQGANVADLQKQIAPLVGGMRNRAFTIARTEGRRVAEAMQEESWKSVDHLMIGVQRFATLDEFTEPSHREWNETIYYKAGFAPPGNTERTMESRLRVPSRANCRCFDVPYLSPA